MSARDMKAVPDLLSVWEQSCNFSVWRIHILPKRGVHLEFKGREVRKKRGDGENPSLFSLCQSLFPDCVFPQIRVVHLDRLLVEAMCSSRITSKKTLVGTNVL